MRNSFRNYRKFVARNMTEHHTKSGVGLLTGLTSEVGEVAALLKHEKVNRLDLANEIGDVLWYLVAICHRANISIGDVIILNMTKLRSRGYK